MSLTKLLSCYQSLTYFHSLLLSPVSHFLSLGSQSSLWLESLSNLFSSAQLISSRSASKMNWQRFQCCRCESINCSTVFWPRSVRGNFRVISEVTAVLLYFICTSPWTHKIWSCIKWCNVFMCLWIQMKIKKFKDAFYGANAVWELYLVRIILLLCI